MTFETELTDEFKEIIFNELYDTGALYESMEIYSEFTPDIIYIQIVCNEYIQYHLARLDLIERLGALASFRAVIERGFAFSIGSRIKETLMGSDVRFPKVEMVLTGI